MMARTREAPRHRRCSRHRATRARYLVFSRPQYRGACWRARTACIRIAVWRPRLGGQPRHAHDLGRQPLSLGDSALPMPDRMHLAARDHPLARRRLRQDIGGHRQARCGGHHTAAPVVVEPPPIGAIRKTLINDDHGQASIASKMRPRLGDQGLGPVGCILLHLSHLDGQ
jgi:hypothetical protein